MISARLAEALQSRRSDFNQRFRLAAQRHPHLDGEELLQFIAHCVDPIVEAVHSRYPGAVDDVLVSAYDCALQLVGQQLTARQGRYAVIADVWREILPAAANVLVTDSRRLIPALTNAVHQLATIDSAAANRWKMRMAHAAAEVTSADDLLLLGLVLAWQCGLAHYRDGALAALDSLSDPLACMALEVTPTRRQETLRRLHADRWFDPTHPQREALRIVRTFGAFRGFGGGFLQPPLIRGTHGGWVVQSAADHWFLVADAFGATLHRASVEEWNSAADREHHVGTRVVHDGQQLDLPGAGPITSSSLSEQAIACTFAHSHQIVLVAMPS
jgi:hypothetical protein